MGIKSEIIDPRPLRSGINDLITGRRLLTATPAPGPDDGTSLGITHEALKLRVIDALDFLNGHPAYEDRFSLMFYWWPSKVCKRGISAEDGQANVWITAEGAERFIANFEEEYEQDIPDFEEAKKKFPLWHVRLPYEDIYGEPWEFANVEYWWEMCFTVYQGSVDRESKECYDEKSWQSYQFQSGGKLTYEECILELEVLTRKYLGEFESYDFETPEEKANHELSGTPFHFESTDDAMFNPMTGLTESLSTMVDNPDWITVHSGMLNRRWLKWFVATDYCKENWGDEFKKLADKQPD